MSDKYKFVKNCDIPEPPQAPIVVPDDFPINPLIPLPPNPTIPLELIAKFLPCKYPNRFPCPEITVESTSPGGGGGSSVTYNCIGKSELIVDFDIESYCCDVIEDEDGNEIDHDKIILTSHSELTLPYPPTIASGILYYLDYTEINDYIDEYNLLHPGVLSLCDRCWTVAHVTALRARGGDPTKFRWYVFTYDDTQHTLTDAQYLYPLINAQGRYFSLDYSFQYGEKVIASLDHCTCKARILSYYSECVAVIGYVRGTCDCSYAEITGPGNVDLPDPPNISSGYYFWGAEPDYPVAISKPFTGYLSKRDNKVYANVPAEEPKKYVGQGTYAGNGYVTGITWRRNIDGYDPTYSGLTSIARIDNYNTPASLPEGSLVTVEKQCETCGLDEKNTVLNAEYSRVRPAAALTSSSTYGATINVNLYSGSGSAGPVVQAINYAGPVQVGDRGMVCLNNGTYHFFKRGPADEEPGPVIHKGLRKKFSGLNGFAIASSKIDPQEVNSLTSEEKSLLILGSRYSTVTDISEEGTAEIDTITADFTIDKSIYDATYPCGYWAIKSLDGDPFNADAIAVKNDAEHLICVDSNYQNKSVSVSDTVKKKEIHIFYDNDDHTQGYRTIANVEKSGLLYKNSEIYGPYNNTDYYWSGHYGALGILCGSQDAEVVDSELSPDSPVAGRYQCIYKAYNPNDANHTPVVTFKYNPIVRGFETYQYYLLNNSYEVKTDGLYKCKVPFRSYTVTGGYLKNLSGIGDTASVTLLDLLQGTQYRVNLNNSPYKIYPGTIILKGDYSRSPDRASSDETYHYVVSQDPSLSENVTFTFTMSNLQDREYTPLTIFNYGTYGWYQKKNVITYNNQKVVIDSKSKGLKLFSQNKEVLYYWAPNTDLSAATYTFKEFFKPDNDFIPEGREKTISLTDSWYPVVYDSNLSKYVLSVGQSSTRCFALYSYTGVAIDQTIHFTFTKAQNLDVTTSIKNAIQNQKLLSWYSGQSSSLRMEPGTSYYWTCPSKTLACDVEPKLPDLVIEPDTSYGTFTCYYWKIVGDQQ